MSIRWLWAEVRSLPLRLKLGLVVFGAGSVLDLIYHASPAQSLDRYLGVDGVGAHLTIFAGMVVILLGVFTQGLEKSRSSPQ